MPAATTTIENQPKTVTLTCPPLDLPSNCSPRKKLPAGTHPYTLAHGRFPSILPKDPPSPSNPHYHITRATRDHKTGYNDTTNITIDRFGTSCNSLPLVDALWWAIYMADSTVLERELGEHLNLERDAGAVEHTYVFHEFDAEDESAVKELRKRLKEVKIRAKHAESGEVGEIRFDEMDTIGGSGRDVVQVGVMYGTPLFEKPRGGMYDVNKALSGILPGVQKALEMGREEILIYKAQALEVETVLYVRPAVDTSGTKYQLMQRHTFDDGTVNLGYLAAFGDLDYANDCAQSYMHLVADVNLWYDFRARAYALHEYSEEFENILEEDGTEGELFKGWMAIEGHKVEVSVVREQDNQGEEYFGPDIWKMASALLGC